MGGLFGWFWMLVLLIITGLVVWALIRYLSGDRTRAQKTPEDILRERYARGEISHEEFQDRMKGLKGE